MQVGAAGLQNPSVPKPTTPTTDDPRGGHRRACSCDYCLDRVLSSSLVLLSAIFSTWNGEQPLRLQEPGVSGLTASFPCFSLDTVFQLHPGPGLFQCHSPLQLWDLRLQPCLHLHCELSDSPLAHSPPTPLFTPTPASPWWLWESLVPEDPRKISSPGPISLSASFTPSSCSSSLRRATLAFWAPSLFPPLGTPRFPPVAHLGGQGHGWEGSKSL